MITASRLGSAPITLDWSNLVNVAVSSTSRGGASPDVHAFHDAWERLKGRFSAGEVGFFNCPVSNELSQMEESIQLAQEILKRGTIRDCLFLGIGGSALGPLAVLAALVDRTRPDISFHFMENPDPLEWKEKIRNLRPESTLVCVVTKSGTTFETVAQFLLSLEWLGKERWKSNVVAITDPAKGDLKAFAQQNGIPTLHIAPSMGGRFSVFTPVGLFAAALSGLNVQEFMLGARQVRDHMEKVPVEKNPLFILGAELIRHSSKRPIHVCMPYSTRLKQISAWFVQLWGESLGKDGKGFTPVGAVGATDQHSILQLLRDGPDDKVTFFITVDKVEDEVRIPRVLQASQFPSFKLLEGNSLHDLLLIEYRATSLVLTRQSRPNVSMTLDRLDERSLGALLFSFAVLTAFTGTLWGVNPFDQPGVEEGKVYIREALSRGGSKENAAYSGSATDDDDNSPVGRLRRHRND